MGIRINYKVGDKIGECIYLEETDKKHNGVCFIRMAIFECPRCKKEFITSISSAKSRNAKSCGCLLYSKDRNVTHGMSGTNEYDIWGNMWNRCSNLKAKNYGGKGILVCTRWEKFENFIADMGKRPTPKHALDRHPNRNGNYEPGNVRWATIKENNNNKTNNILLTYKKVTKTLKQWAESLGLRYNTLLKRYYNGWSVVEILTTPIGIGNTHNK